ncbi:LptE family protein [Gangjinia marincola]|uniref:LptE family protein n=1 Tax=Gangjinia marincola TaxID=578463 RepID=A0ABP3XQ72_9FLAO
MKRFLYIVLFVIVASLSNSCGIYSFTGANTGNAENFQVNFFQNTAAIIEPGIDQQFTNRLQDLILQQTNLALTNQNGDLIYEGEITRYYISPISATADNTAAQNRLTVAVNCRFFNRLDDTSDFEKSFSFYFDFPANQQLIGATLDEALDEVFTRITQDIFNESLANW